MISSIENIFPWVSRQYLQVYKMVLRNKSLTTIGESNAVVASLYATLGIKKGKPYKGFPVVGVSGFEPEASWTRIKRVKWQPLLFYVI